MTRARRRAPALPGGAGSDRSTREPNAIEVPLHLVFQRAFSMEARGDRLGARALYEQVLAAIPEHPGALLRIALQQRGDGDVDGARSTLERAIASVQRMALPAAEIWLALGETQERLGDREAARRAYREAAQAAPGLATPPIALGNLALAEGDPRQAEAEFRRSIALDPSSTAWMNLALALWRLGRLGEADEAARTAIAAGVHSAEAWQIAASISLQRGEPDEARARCRQGLALAPRHPALLHVLALARVAAGDRREARNALLAAVEGAPQDVAIRLALGAVCLDLGLPAEAQRHLEQAIAAGAASAEAYDNLGLALRRQRKLPEAIDAFARAVSSAPRLTPARANLLLALREACDWARVGRAEAELLALLGDPGADPRCAPYVTLLSIADPAKQREMICRWSAAQLPAATSGAGPGAGPGIAGAMRSAPATIATRGMRLRVGYLSADLHDHATARLTAGLFERQDRRRFELYAYSHGPDDGSALRRRLRGAFEHWVDLAALDDAAAARSISDDGIDVLVDLKGHTDGARPGILARRPAPLQIHYLGFPGTLGFGGVDALVADPIVVPEGDDAHYAERVIRLPRCYQVNDRDRLLPAAPSRASLGLPERAVVLACFNAPHKLSPGFFRAWLAALKACDDAVLWIYAPHPTTRAHLIGEAAQAGLAGERIVFAPTADHAEHIARLRAADLALDLLPYGSHTTGSDALWAGVPMLSAAGATFAGRVGASLLQAVALDELVAGSLADYGETLVTLVRDRERLQAYREHLERRRLELPLFDTDAFTRDWERMLESEVG